MLYVGLIVFLSAIGLLFAWSSWFRGDRSGRQVQSHVGNEDKTALIERAHEIRARREASAARATEALPAFDAEASAQRVKDAVQQAKASTSWQERVAQIELARGDVPPEPLIHRSGYGSPTGLSMTVQVSYGPTGSDIQQYTRWYLLSRFESGADIYAFENHPVYAHRLETSPVNVLLQFIENDWIRKLDAAQSLDHNLKATDLKAILKAHGRPVSGRKADLVQRVLDLDDDKVRQAKVSPYFIMTETGRRAIAPFYEQEQHRHAVARRAIEQAVRDGDIGQALMVSEEYDRLLMWGTAQAQNDAMGRQILANILSSRLGNAKDRELAAVVALISQSPPGVPGRLLN